MRHASDDINARSRRLMDEPSGEQRAAEYIRLLTLWAEATRHDLVTAA